ncbi:MAG: HAD-IA family hydrolase [Chloroflexota bacterium]
MSEHEQPAGPASALTTIIFDLSEVFIYGLHGMELVLPALVGTEAATIVPALAGDGFRDLMEGTISEDAYLAQLLAREGWPIAPEPLKAMLRRNFRRAVPGTWAVLERLNPRLERHLLSDHAREWIAYIEGVHPFLSAFQQRFYSFALGSTKRETVTFATVLARLGRPPEACLFIDDNPKNIAVAEAVGLHTVHFTTAAALAERLNAQGLLS